MSELAGKNWFFLGTDLYKYISANRAKNQLKAFCYTDHRPKVLTLSETKRYKLPAFDVSSVGFMLNRANRTIHYYIDKGFITPSGKSGPADDPFRGKWWFTPDEVMDLREAIAENCKTSKAPLPLPSREEVLTMTRTKKMLYVQEGDDFVPVWRASAW